MKILNISFLGQMCWQWIILKVFVLLKYLFLIHFWSIILLDIKFYIYFQYFKYFTTLCCFHGFWWEVFCNSYPCFSIDKIPPFSFKILPLVLCSLNIIYWGVHFWGGIYLGVLWASWVCDSVFAINFGKFSAFATSNVSSPMSFFFWHSNYVYAIPFKNFSTVLGYFVLIYFILFYFIYFGNFLWHIFNLPGSFLGCVEYTDEPIKVFLHFLL